MPLELSLTNWSHSPPQNDVIGNAQPLKSSQRYVGQLPFFLIRSKNADFKSRKTISTSQTQISLIYLKIMNYNNNNFNVYIIIVINKSLNLLIPVGYEDTIQLLIII